MNKNILWLLGILLSLSIGFASCSEDTPEADPYSDWAVRNDAYIDSIASVCANPPAGESWLRVLDYKIQTEASEGLGNQTYTPGKNDYVYMKLFRKIILNRWVFLPWELIRWLYTIAES